MDENETLTAVEVEKAVTETKPKKTKEKPTEAQLKADLKKANKHIEELLNQIKADKDYIDAQRKQLASYEQGTNRLVAKYSHITKFVLSALNVFEKSVKMAFEEEE